MNSKKFLKRLVKLTGKTLKYRYLWLFVTLIGLSLDTILSFSTIFSVEYFKRGHQKLAILFLMLTVSSQIVYSIYRVLINNVESKYTMHTEELSNRETVDVLGVVKGKIYVTEDNKRRRLSSVEIQDNTKNYISKNIEFTDQVMNSVSDLVAFVIMFIGTITATLLSVKNVPSLILIMATCISVIIIITIRQVKRREVFYAERRKLNDEVNLQKMDLLNISPINQKHQNFLTEGYVQTSKTIQLKKIKLDLKDSIENCYKSGAMAISTILLLIIAIFSYESLNMEIFASLMALSNLYRNMLLSLTREISSIQRLMDMYSEKKSYDKIMNIIADKYLDLSNKSSLKNEQITNITMNELDYIHEDTEKKVVHRIIADKILFSTGESTLISGPSGSGKSTLLKILTGDYSYGEDQIIINNSFNRESIYNYLLYDPDSLLGNKSILEEITFESSKNNIDRQKFIEIMKGLNLYEVIMAKAKNEPLLDYLSCVYKDTFSAGQLQRFVLARLLYNLDKHVEVILLDEPVANLDDNTAHKVIGFITNFCNRDSSRIVIISSHQVKIVEKYCKGKYNFNNIEENYFKVEPA